MTSATLTPEATKTEPNVRPFNQEQCDACGARGLWAVKFTASELAFCGHHYNRFQESFADKEKFKLS